MKCFLCLQDDSDELAASSGPQASEVRQEWACVEGGVIVLKQGFPVALDIFCFQLFCLYKF